MVHCLAQGHCKCSRRTWIQTLLLVSNPLYLSYLLLSSELPLYPSVLPHLVSSIISSLILLSYLLFSFLLPHPSFFPLLSHVVSFFHRSSLLFFLCVSSSFPYDLSLLSFLLCCLIFFIPILSILFCPFPFFPASSFLSSPLFIHPLIFSITITIITILLSLLCSCFLSFYPFLTSSFFPFTFSFSSLLLILPSCRLSFLHSSPLFLYLLSYSHFFPLVLPHLLPSSHLSLFLLTFSHSFLSFPLVSSLFSVLPLSSLRVSSVRFLLLIWSI